jgi:O-acetyl-ADP-ribose deacetylase (regulator of RNase III)
MANKVLQFFTFPAGQRLEIVHGDLTQEPVEAIVNAANSHLLHGGGVAAWIVKRGGPRVQAESLAWVRDRGPVSFTSPAYTGAGELPYRFILHAVGPVWGEGDEDHKLATAIISTLDLASQLKINKLSLPAISTGIFGFPKDRAARVMLKTLSQYFQEHPTSFVHQVRLVLFDFETANLFLETANKMRIFDY